MNWISVKKSLPDSKTDVLFVEWIDGKPFLCFGRKRDDDPSSLVWLDDLNLDYDGAPSYTFNVSHWMPTPDLPQSPE